MVTYRLAWETMTQCEYYKADALTKSMGGFI